MPGFDSKDKQHPSAWEAAKGMGRMVGDAGSILKNAAIADYDWVTGDDWGYDRAKANMNDYTDQATKDGQPAVDYAKYVAGMF